MTCHITWTPEVRRAHGEVSGRSQRFEIEQGTAFARAWREGRREEVLARYAEPGTYATKSPDLARDWAHRLGRFVLPSDGDGPPRAAIGHIPFPSSAPRAGSALPAFPDPADDGEGRLAFSPSPSVS